MPRTIPQQALPGLQEGRFLPPGGQLETTQSIHNQVPLRDGRDKYAEGPSDEERLDGFTRYEGRLFFGGCEGGGQKVPSIHLGRTGFRVSMPTLWSEQCPTGLHQVTETNSGFPQAPGNQTGDISRRHDGPSSIEGRPRSSNEPGKSDAQTVGVHDQLGEVTADPIPAHSVPGFLDRLAEHGDSSHQGEDRAISPDLQGCQAARKTLGEGPIQTTWKYDCHNPSNRPGPTVVPEPAECEESSPTHVRILRSDGSLDTRGPGGAGLVDHSDGFLQRTECFQSGTRFDYGIRCIPTGMGSSVQRYPHRRPLVPLRASGTYQLPGIDSGSFCGQSFLWEQEGCPHPSEIGQSDSGSIYKPHGRDSFLSAEQPCYRAVEVVSGAGTNPVSRTSGRGGQLCGRCGVSDDSVLSRVATSQGGVSEPDAECVSVQCRPLCNASELSTPTVCQLEAGSFRNRDRCASDNMDQMERLRFSPLRTDQQSAEEGTRGEVSNPPHSASLGISTLVPSSAVSVSELPHSSSSTSQPPSRPVWPTPSPVTDRPASSSRVDTIRGGYTAAGISAEAAALWME